MGQKLQVNIEGLGPMEVTGEWMDHMPPMPIVPNMDPKADELRIISPVLLRDKAVVLDMEGGSAIGDERRRGVELYEQGEGRFQIALTPFAGAVKGKISQNRISFEIDRQPYELIAGAPIARSKNAWIRRDAKYIPEKNEQVSAYIGEFKIDGNAEQK
jgi:hypothetical protein